MTSCYYIMTLFVDEYHIKQRIALDMAFSFLFFSIVHWIESTIYVLITLHHGGTFT